MTTLDQVRVAWPRVRQVLRATSRRAEALLASADPIRIDGETLTLVAAYDFHRDAINHDSIRPLVDEAVSHVLDRPLNVWAINQEQAGIVPAPDNTTQGADDDWKFCRHCGALVPAAMAVCDECGGQLSIAPPPAPAVTRAQDISGAWPHAPAGETGNLLPVQEIRATLLADLAKYRRALRAIPHDHAGRARWLEERPALSDFLRWYESSAGLATRQDCGDVDAEIIEHYLARRFAQ